MDYFEIKKYLRSSSIQLPTCIEELICDYALTLYHERKRHLLNELTSYTLVFNKCNHGQLRWTRVPKNDPDEFVWWLEQMTGCRVSATPSNTFTPYDNAKHYFRTAQMIVVYMDSVMYDYNSMTCSIETRVEPYLQGNRVQWDLQFGTVYYTSLLSNWIDVAS
jgi:hypothetical protein